MALKPRLQIIHRAVQLKLRAGAQHIRAADIQAHVAAPGGFVGELGLQLEGGGLLGLQHQIQLAAVLAQFRQQARKPQARAGPVQAFGQLIGAHGLAAQGFQEAGQGALEGRIHAQHLMDARLPHPQYQRAIRLEATAL